MQAVHVLNVKHGHSWSKVSFFRLDLVASTQWGSVVGTKSIVLWGSMWVTSHGALSVSFLSLSFDFMLRTSFHDDIFVQFCYWMKVVIAKTLMICFLHCCILKLLTVLLVGKLSAKLTFRDTAEFCVLRLHKEDQDHWCCLQCLQQRACQNQNPGEELRRPRRQPSLQAVVWGPLRHSSGTQEGSQTGTWYNIMVETTAYFLIKYCLIILSRLLNMPQLIDFYKVWQCVDMHLISLPCICLTRFAYEGMCMTLATHYF